MTGKILQTKHNLEDLDKSDHLKDTHAFIFCYVSSDRVFVLQLYCLSAQLNSGVQKVYM